MFASAAMALVLGSCAKCPETMKSQDELVGDYNANATAVPRLWARAKIRITLSDDKGRTASWGSTSPVARPNGLLLLGKGPKVGGPHDFVLIGRETASYELFRLGSSVADGVYYLWYRMGQQSRAWYGMNKYAGAAGASSLPIDPNQLLAVLAVCELPADFTDCPTVIRTMSTDPCAYVLTYIERQPITGRIVSRREVYFRWAEGKPARPFMVNFFDHDGMRVMNARLKDYRPIDTGDSDGEGEAMMPTDIKITWPKKNSSIHLLLSEMTTEDKWSRKACRLAEHLPAGITQENITRVDASIPKETPDSE